MKKTIYICFVLLATLGIAKNTKAQCPAGQVNVSVTIHTDGYGKECYWELVPGGNACGTGTLLSGGNTLQVGCTGGGTPTTSTTGNGYANTTMYSSSSVCVTAGSSLSLKAIDDYGDGGTHYVININGLPVYDYMATAATETFTFAADSALPYNMACTNIATAGYNIIGTALPIRGELFNRSANTITSLTLKYQINAGTPVTLNLTGLSIAPFTEYTYLHTTNWTPVATGTYTVKVWAEALNGNADGDITDDVFTKSIIIADPVPFLIDHYKNYFYIKTVINKSSDGVLQPRDLDFHPTLSRDELWVVLESDEATGGKTIKYTNAGKPSQIALKQKDGNAWHFMSLPTAIAFSSDNENFATSPGVYDANHNGGSPFTGPALWSSNPAIYAMPSGGNGSHLDMLHQSPYSMGICHQKDNAFWVADGDGGNIVFYDFKKDHGAGHSDHSDGVIRRYVNTSFYPDLNHEISSHLVLDKTSNWLYYVSTGDAKVKRLDITTGSFSNNLTPSEATAEYSVYSGSTQEDYITTGFTSPSGIDLYNNRLIVSDFATGTINMYDVSGTTPTLTGTIYTGDPGIMGVKIGPDGLIWYVNKTLNQVVRLDTTNTINGIETVAQTLNVFIYPNPTATTVKVSSYNTPDEIILTDCVGKTVKQSKPTATYTDINVADLATGLYFIQVKKGNQTVTKKFNKI
jgi:hypothetical protein